MKAYVIVWLGLLLIVAVEVLLTSAHLAPGRLLASLLVLAFLEAGLALMYLMNLKYERSSLFLSLIPYLVFALFMMDHMWPDAFRLMHQRSLAP
jgi:hypothetical protein